MLVNDKSYAEIKLNDFYGFQKVSFKDIKVPYNKNLVIKFVITDVYPGEKYSDTSISQVEFTGSGVFDQVPAVLLISCLFTLKVLYLIKP